MLSDSNLFYHLKQFDVNKSDSSYTFSTRGSIYCNTASDCSSLCKELQSNTSYFKGLKQYFADEYGLTDSATINSIEPTLVNFTNSCSFSSSSSKKKKKDDDSVAIIIGFIVGGFVIVVIAILMYLLGSRTKTESKQTEQDLDDVTKTSACAFS